MSFVRSVFSRFAGPIILLITVGILLLVGEGLVRFAHLAPDIALIEKWRYRLASNPKIGFEPVPYVNSLDVDVQYYSYRGKSNRLGFRDDDHLEEKPADVYRILVLGDSVALGLWINDDNLIFSSILDRDLKAKGKRVEVMNFSVAGYNTLQEVETLKDKGLAFRPDLVLLAYCQNDRERDDGGLYLSLLEAERTGNSIHRSRFLPYLSKSALYRFISYRFIRPELHKNFESYQLKEWELVGPDSVETSLAELGVLSNKYKFKVLLALLPKFSPNGRSVEATPEHDLLQESSKRFGFQFLDLAPNLERCIEQDPSLMAYDPFHLTIEGHLCVGLALGDQVSSMIERN